MKILVLTSAYPSENDVYSNAFVHSRVMEYKKNYQIDVDVLVCRRKIEKKEYYYDEVLVKQTTEKNLVEILNKENYDKIIVHFLTVPMMNSLKMTNNNFEILVWVHGEEALSWKSRLFNWKQKKFLKYIFSNIIQLNNYKKFSKKKLNVKYIFVSEWMKEKAEKDIGIKFENYSIIPNGIDTDFFNQRSLDKEKVRVLMVRPFTSKKYATDIAIEAIYKLSKREKFNEFEFTLYGNGPLLEKQTKKIKNFNNVKINPYFLNKKELKVAHSSNSIFLCPTRQDAQGVSMCEAMSSGLVPISSFSTAIPEFVDNGVNGFLTNSSDDIVESLIFLRDNRELISEMGDAARNNILIKCSKEKIIKKEIELMYK